LIWYDDGHHQNDIAAFLFKMEDEAVLLRFMETRQREIREQKQRKREKAEEKEAKEIENDIRAAWVLWWGLRGRSM